MTTLRTDLSWVVAVPIVTVRLMIYGAIIQMNILYRATERLGGLGHVENLFEVEQRRSGRIGYGGEGQTLANSDKNVITVWVGWWVVLKCS